MKNKPPDIRGLEERWGRVQEQIDRMQAGADESPSGEPGQLTGASAGEEPEMAESLGGLISAIRGYLADGGNAEEIRLILQTRGRQTVCGRPYIGRDGRLFVRVLDEQPARAIELDSEYGEWLIPLATKTVMTGYTMKRQLARAEPLDPADLQGGEYLADYLESRGQRGRDSKDFLNTVFVWMKSQGGISSVEDQWKRWRANVLRDEKGSLIIDMKMSRDWVRKMPTEFIDRTENLATPPGQVIIETLGVDSLLDTINRKKVISVRTPGDYWYLRVVQ